MITAIIPKLPFINKQQTIDFYGKHLDFVLSNDYEDYLLMLQGELELHFFSYPKLIPGKSDFMIYLRLDRDIEKLYERLASGNMPHLYKLETKPWGQKEFSIVDPNGTLLTFGMGS